MILQRLERAYGPDHQLDCVIWRWYCRSGFEIGLRYRKDDAPKFTASLDAAVSLVNRVLPGWWWKVIQCSVSDDAWVCPDYNSPVHGPRLFKQFPPDACPEFETHFDLDRRPAGTIAIALCQSVFMACCKIEELGLNPVPAYTNGLAG